MKRTDRLNVGIAMVIWSIVCVTPPCDAKVAQGDLDPTFGTGGLVTTDFGLHDEAHSVTIDGQGRIVTAGYTDAGGTNHFALARYNTNGELDTTFGTNGRVITDIGDSARANVIAIDNQGKIVAAGYADEGGARYLALARYNTDGSLDTDFGTDGKVTVNFYGWWAYAQALAIDTSGKIIAAGSALLSRYNMDGSLDTTFGTDGVVVTEIFDGNLQSANAIALDSSGKIVVAGTACTYVGEYCRDNFALSRYNTDGSLDTTFGTNGKVTTVFIEGESWANALAIDSHGKIIVVGNILSDPDFALARYDSEGSLDSSFSIDGKVTTSFGIGWSVDSAHALAMDSNGKIIVAGISNGDFALACYNSDGTPDTAFGAEGKVTTDFGEYQDEAFGISVDGSKIVVAGTASGLDFAVARYIAEETNPPTGSITINEGTEAIKSREVTLTLAATDDTPGKIQMCISNTMTCRNWTAFAETKSWTLATGDGTKTVSVWFKDVWGNVNSTPYSDTIILDIKDPIDGTVTATPGNLQVALEWTGFTDTLSGLGSYKVVFSEGSVPASCSEGREIYSGTDTSYIHTDLTNGKKYGYRVCAIDEAGNISIGATATTKPRPELNPPTGSITIKGGAEAAKCRNVTLTLTATDATPEKIKMCISNTSTCRNWAVFAKTKSWTLATGDGTKAVSVWFRDVWGNESDIPYSDTILLDTVAPTNGTVEATPGVGQVTLEWTGFADAGSGIGDYKVLFSRGSVPASCFEGKQIYTGPDTTYLHTGLTSGTSYYYRVCAIDEAGNISTGKTAKAKPQ